MPYYFDGFELCNALKPFLVRELFRRGYEQIIYLDSDIFVVGDFAAIWLALKGKSLIVTPHHLHPPPLSLLHTNEVGVADMGFINGGFMAWSGGVQTDEIVTWMCERYPVYGFCDRRAGMFVDQKLLPLVLQYFPERVEVARDRGLNIGFWNAHERPVQVCDSGYMVDDKCVTFFHLSGYRLSQPDLACSYEPGASNASILASAPWFRSVMRDYKVVLEKFWVAKAAAQYKYGYVDGLRTTPGLRRLYFEKGQLLYTDPAVLSTLLTDFLKRLKRRIRPYRPK
jgi:hypothetical protein